GLGGGKYDELTDAIIRRFHGIEPPAYLVLSATLLLAFPRPAATPEQRCRLARAVRDLHYNPQRHLDGMVPAPALAELLQRKRMAVVQQPHDASQRRERFQRIRALTAEIRPFLAGRAQQVREELARCEAELEAAAILRRRDYAFCLYPEGLLRPFCERFLEDR